MGVLGVANGLGCSGCLGTQRILCGKRAPYHQTSNNHLNNGQQAEERYRHKLYCHSLFPATPGSGASWPRGGKAVPLPAGGGAETPGNSATQRGKSADAQLPSAAPPALCAGNARADAEGTADAKPRVAAPTCKTDIPNFETLLTTAEANRNKLLAARKDKTNPQWRLVEAEKRGAAKRAAIDEEVKALAVLEDHPMDLLAEMPIATSWKPTAHITTLRACAG